MGLNAGLQGFNMWKLINVTHYRSIKDKIHVVISTDAEKNTWQNPTAFMIEILNKPEGEEDFLNLIKDINEKPSNNIHT